MRRNIYQYSDLGVYVDILEGVLDVRPYQELGEDEQLVFKAGVTDESPPKEMALYPGVSPKMIDGVWVEDPNAINSHIQSLIKELPIDEDQAMADMVADLMIADAQKDQEIQALTDMVGNLMMVGGTA